MIKKYSTLKYGQPVLWFTAVLLISLIAVDVVIVSQQRKLLMDIRQQNVRNELDIMGTLVREALLKKDYRTVEDFLTQWGKERKDVLEIRAVTPNNFVLAEYKSALPAKHPFPMLHKVYFDEEYLITLDLVKDFANIENSMDKLNLKLVVGSIIFISILGFFLWHTVNITAMKPLEREIAERKKAEESLERSNEELKTFTYISSHDLRTPLVNMKGFAGELRHALQDINAVINEALPSLGEKNRTKLLTAFLKDVPEALGFIDSSANRMDELINAISKLSNLGRQELKPELIQVETVVQSVLKDLQLVIEKEGIKVNVGPLPEILADRNSLQMIFGSILDNAVKYLRPGVPGEIEISAERGPGGTVFSIRDNGRGIPNDEIYKVFEMFRRVGEQNTPGEGVGLACTKTLVRRHGGHIWCESAPGTGTTFHFSIPENARFPDQASS